MLDTVVLRIIEPEKLISNENGLKVLTEEFRCNRKTHQICQKIPQYLSESDRKTLQDVSDQSSSIMTIVIYGGLS